MPGFFIGKHTCKQKSRQKKIIMWGKRPNSADPLEVSICSWSHQQDGCLSWLLRFLKRHRLFMWLLPNSDCDALPGTVQQLRSLYRLQSERNVGQTGAIITPPRLSLLDQATRLMLRLEARAASSAGEQCQAAMGRLLNVTRGPFCSRKRLNTGVSHVSRLDHILRGGRPAPFPLPLRSKALGLHHKAAGGSSTEVGGLCAEAGSCNALRSRRSCAVHNLQNK